MTDPIRRTFLKQSIVAAASLSGLAAHATAAGESPVATTRHGQVRGYRDNGVHVFKGVRYGADTAARRFMGPLPPQPWSGVRDAVTHGASAPQSDRAEATGEDCLFLNVYTPGLHDGAKRPVMFYIHGGAYNNGSGSSPLYDGVRLCRRGDVVVVTVNHRLNAFGYLYLARHGDERYADSGNAGQLDLVLALQWVRDNIAAFGGDPDNVTVFGQSGGGAKIATLMAMPAAAGLFRRAATMSGQQVTASGPLNAALRAQALLDALKLPAARIDEIRTLPYQRIVEVLGTRDPVLPFGGISFAPVLDERNLLRHPFYPDAPPQSARIPMMIGNTHDETRAFLGGDPANFTLTWDQLPAKLVPNMRVDIQPESVIAAYRKLYPALSPGDLLFRITTASRSWRGAIIEAEERAKSGSPAFVYQLDWATPKDGGRFGAPHASDIQLVFDNIAKPGATAIGPQAQPMADMMSEAFIAFARRGDPNSKLIPRWEPYDMARRQTMIFDVPPRLEDDPRGAERRIFAKVPYVQPGT
ncbi:carboxylesterase/lipase family protein [Pseudoduganella umbonata]|uniref:Carboxylic ester hydrolase n=1 Tax=Pseudoduganella umbonata TaxID=864828 RepID=A0A4P8HUX9_9BURK|nr:carboxylesterase/lipase family protein [Pseudoduganella umbonata]MBB3222384.1 para-nitrobenzyl esterase [Pseudoduganella umbonata]QCP12598.1 carboxylesterase/lipase family protein [Pseudoduganella umbonata]